MYTRHFIIRPEWFIMLPMTSIRRNVPLLYAFSFLQMTLFPMAVITLFWKDHIGLSLSEILLLQSIFAMAMVVMEYPSGYISDRVGYRTALTAASILGILGWGVYTVAASFRDVLIAEILLGISTSFISGTDSALLFESLKGTGEEAAYARHEGRSTGFGQTGEAMGALFAGVLYARYPLLPFILQVGVWVLALLLTRGLTEPQREPRNHGSHLQEALVSARYVFIQNRRLRVTILLSIVLGISSFYPVWLIQSYMRDSGVPLASFGPVWAGANLIVALFAVLSHRVRDRLGDQVTILLLVVLVWGGYLGLGCTAGVWSFLFYYLITAMRGMRGPFLLHVAQAEIPSANRAGMLSLQSLCFRLLFALTGPLVGKYADACGVRKTFQLLFIAFLLVLPPLVWLFLKYRHDNDAVGESGIPKKPAFPLRLFYDGSCIVCATEIGRYGHRDRHGRLILVDISAPDFDPTPYGISLDAFMYQMHAIDADGTVFRGVDAFWAIWQAFPTSTLYGILGALVTFPPLAPLARLCYRAFARIRGYLPKRRRLC